MPLQARSKERVERILEAAELVIAEVGYDAATTEAIAARAGTSIGSVYQFFPNKKAIFDAVAARCRDQARDVLEATLSPEVLALPWPQLVDAAIEAFWSFSVDQPAFRAVWLQGNLTMELVEAGEALNREMAGRAEAMIGLIAPRVAKKRRAVLATVLVETVSAMLLVAGRRGEPLGSALREETKLLLHRYLADEIDPPPAKKRRRR